MYQNFRTQRCCTMHTGKAQLHGGLQSHFPALRRAAATAPAASACRNLDAVSVWPASSQGEARTTGWRVARSGFTCRVVDTNGRQELLRRGQCQTIGRGRAGDGCERTPVPGHVDTRRPRKRLVDGVLKFAILKTQRRAARQKFKNEQTLRVFGLRGVDEFKRGALHDPVLHRSGGVPQVSRGANSIKL